MSTEVWLQGVVILMALWGAFVSLFPATGTLWKVGHLIVFVCLGATSFALVVRQSYEAQEQVKLTQQKLDQSVNQQQSLLEGNRVLEGQNRDLDAQLRAIREKFGVPAEFDRNISEQVRAEVEVEATVEKGAGRRPQEGR